MKYQETQLTEDHRPVGNNNANENASGQYESFSSFTESTDLAQDQDPPPNPELSELPGIEMVENYSPHLLRAFAGSGAESGSIGEEPLLEAWTASYDPTPGFTRRIISEGDAMEKIIGADDRVQIRNTRRFPWRAICQLTMTARNGRRYLGTGWFVNSRTIITAAHNIYMHRAGGWARSVQVTPGMNNRQQPFGTYRATAFRTIRGWINGPNPNYDYAAIILPRSTPARIGGQYFKIGSADAQRLRGRYLNISGYPGDKGGKTQWFHARPMKRLTARRLYYTIDTMGGHSGSPVFLRERNGDRVAVAIHAYGGSTENSGTRFVGPVLRNLIRWRNEGR